jgi:hypothetical protein
MLRQKLSPGLFPSTATAAAMTLTFCALFALAGCSGKPAPVVDNGPTLSGTSTQNKYVVTMHPSNGPIVINQMHTWEIKLTNSVGEPISKAQFEVGGGMPQHNHGFPTQPRVTKELGDGRYLLEGMKFSMSGWWELKLAINGDKGADNVTLNTIVATEDRQAPAASGPPNTTKGTP